MMKELKKIVFKNSSYLSEENFGVSLKVTSMQHLRYKVTKMCALSFLDK